MVDNGRPVVIRSVVSSGDRVESSTSPPRTLTVRGRDARGWAAARIVGEEEDADGVAGRRRGAIVGGELRGDGDGWARIVGGGLDGLMERIFGASVMVGVEVGVDG